MDTPPIGEHLFSYKGKLYPNHIKQGNACKFIEPFALPFCKGEGLDIGGYAESILPGATPINVRLREEWDAYTLPDKKYDYIFSSHTLEHLPDYIKALQYWTEHLKPRGVLFLYLPHPDMEYWLPQNDRKHLHVFYPQAMEKVLRDLGFEYVLWSECDFYWSFVVVGILH